MILSRKITICHEMFHFTMLQVLPSRCHQMSWKIFLFMVTFDDMVMHDVVKLIQGGRFLNCVLQRLSVNFRMILPINVDFSIQSFCLLFQFLTNEQNSCNLWYMGRMIWRRISLGMKRSESWRWVQEWE